MSSQAYAEAVSWITATPTAVANNASVAVLPANVTIPANYLQRGRILRLRAFGSYGTTSTPTLTFTIYWGGTGGTVLAKSAAITLTSAVGGGASMTAPWEAEVYIQTRADGATGSLFTMGAGNLFTSTAATAGTVTNYGLPFAIVSGSTGGTTPVAVTVDLTADTALSFAVTWGTANAANSIQVTNYVIESLN